MKTTARAEAVTAPLPRVSVSKETQEAQAARGIAARRAAATKQIRPDAWSGKMSVMGVGGKIAVPTLLYAAAAEGVSLYARPAFRITGDRRALRTLRITGSAMAAAGFSLNLAAAFAMLKAHSEERLATGGLYRLFRDPMYTLQIFITLPGLFLFLNSWLVLTGVVPAYFAYRVFVREEHKYLESKFGEEYRQYLQKVVLKI